MDNVAFRKASQAVLWPYGQMEVNSEDGKVYHVNKNAISFGDEHTAVCQSMQAFDLPRCDFLTRTEKLEGWCKFSMLAVSVAALHVPNATKNAKTSVCWCSLKQHMIMQACMVAK